ncbi:hypothetical protein HK103_003080 [Boothiomyces macroporosus]|uniref:Uncharacterized protein n=1 Tax=Boothiomyces macroporosus TaxID=261099 RepID=A0AAD5Y4K4_9FUNG|nr:hypothetical protein HK103_003080 [Boothiomyces macroporosus]
MDMLDYIRDVETIMNDNPSREFLKTLDAKGDVKETTTYSQIWRRSNTIWLQLVEKGAKQGDRIVFLYGLDMVHHHVAAFLACLRGGFVPVSAFPPNPKNLDHQLKSFRFLVENSGAKLALTCASYKGFIDITTQVGSQWPVFDAYIITELTESDQHPSCLAYKHTADDLVFIQFTSGSTGNPKGVMVNYNSFQNCLKFTQAQGLAEDGHTYLLWIPIYHDYCLVVTLSTLRLGIPLMMMDTTIFTTNPLLWPECLERYKVTCTCGPNFSFGMVSKLAAATGRKFDLSFMQRVDMGSEPIRKPTVEAMVSVLNIARENINQSYGFAEACLLVSTRGTGFDPETNIASCGDIQHSRDHRVEIVVADCASGRILEDGETGDIMVQGPSVVAGYWANPEATEKAFRNKLKGRDGYWYLSGDLGYIKNNQLYISGRSKDLIIVNGKNFYSTDIETAIDSILAGVIAFGSTAAVQAYDDSATVVCEFMPGKENSLSLEKLVAIRKQLTGYLGINIEDILICSAGSVPKTDSNKVRRNETKVMYLEGRFDPILRINNVARPAVVKSVEKKAPEPQTDFEKFLVLCASELGIELSQLDKAKSFVEMGGDSITAIKLASKAAELNLKISTQIIDEVKSRYCAEFEFGKYDLYPATPTQSAMISATFRNPSSYGMQLTWQVTGTLEIEKFKTACLKTIQSHEILCSRFVPTSKGVYILVQPVAQPPVSVLENAEKCEFRVEDDSWIRFTLLTANGVVDKLVLSIHHALYDGWCIGTIMTDLFANYQSKATKGSLFKPLVQYIENQDRELQKQFWKEYMNNALPLPPIQSEPESESFGTSQVQFFTTATVNDLARISKNAKVTVSALLKAAWALTLRRFTSRNDIMFGNIVSGRDIPLPMVESIVGVLASTVPFRTSVELDKQMFEWLQAIHQDHSKVAPWSHTGLVDIAKWTDLDTLGPMFNSLFVLENISTANRLAPTDLPFQLGATPITQGTGEFDLEILLTPHETKIEVQLEYQTSKLSKGTVEMVGKYFDVCLSEISNTEASTSIKDVVEVSHQKTHTNILDIGADLMAEIYEDWVNEEDLGKSFQVYPILPLQMPMILKTAKEPSAFSVQLIWEIKEKFEIAKLQKALDMFVNSNDAMRARYITTSQGVYKLVPEHSEVRVNVVEQSLKEYCQQDANRGFGFQEKEWYRMAVTCTNGIPDYIVFSIHHVLYDGFCLDNIIDGIFLNYGKFGSTLSDLPQSKSVVEYVFSRDLTEAELYWKDYFRNCTASVGFMKCPDPVPANGPLKMTCQTTMTNLANAAAKGQTTIGNLIKCAWALTLKTYTLDSDVVFGTLVSGRDLPVPGIESIIGMLINMLPVRLDFKDISTIQHMLDLIQQDHLATMPYSYCDISDIHAWSRFRTKGQLIFNTALVYENVDVTATKTYDNLVSPVQVDVFDSDAFTYSNLFAAFEMLLFIIPRGEQLEFVTNYDSSILSNALAYRISNTFQQNLDAIAHSLLQNKSYDSITLIDTLQSAEIDSLISLGTGPTYAVPFDCMHLPFEATARSDPDMIAVEHGDLSITYGELNSKAESIAATLMNRGVRPGDYVGIVTVRSIEMVAAIYGVLKTGAAYVPVDSTLPLERINYILETAQCSLSLVHPSTPASVADSLATAAALKIDEHMLNTAPVSALPAVDGSSPAFVVFTSGSTGQPKGVTIKHSSLCNFIMQPRDILDVKKGSRVGQICTITFDACACEVFSALSHGGTLVLRTEDFIGTLQKCENIMTPPSLLSKLSPADFPNLKVVVSIGEPCPQHIINTWGAVLKLKNGYGPSEITIISSSTVLQPGKPITVGKPEYNTVQYIVDKNMQLVPRGVAGELVIGGMGVSLGYLNRPDLTAERFIHNHFLNDGSTMYRTGDICRWTEDGEIQIIGRVDDMVKVKGYRIELDEVASAINKHADVHASVVLVRSQMLVAYVTPVTVDMDKLREFVSDILPHYMIPTVFVPVKEFKINNNGKVNFANCRSIRSISYRWKCLKNSKHLKLKWKFN